MYVLGIDPGYGAAPTGCALVGFADGTPRLIDTRELRPRRGGDWQRRVYDVLSQLHDWLAIELLPFYPNDRLLLAYEVAHLRERKDDQYRPIRKSDHERANGTHVLNPAAALRLESLGGGVRGLAAAYGLDCIGVSAAESKLALTGRADADKQMMIDGARMLFGRDLSEHEADAVGHALAGEAAWRRARLVREATS